MRLLRIGQLVALAEKLSAALGYQSRGLGSLHLAPRVVTLSPKPVSGFWGSIRTRKQWWANRVVGIRKRLRMPAERDVFGTNGRPERELETEAKKCREG
ncbi:hypothetical protein NDU88_004176 [Pleurodeles waltl]|uniref:Uncharacterized protein n=1 Tax=Pleurodeles waltl TaxID=8319 RepID=A0AAV7T8K7_PLEWA|nr:hypothetical protein NDU88_004176 [Pleurodeles waltl]